MNSKNQTPENNKYYTISYSRICKRSAQDVRLGMAPTYTVEGEAESVWYNDNDQKFYLGEYPVCKLSDVIYWKADSAPVAGIAYM